MLCAGVGYFRTFGQFGVLSARIRCPLLLGVGAAVSVVTTRGPSTRPGALPHVNVG